jgi:hypothetical protein
MTRAEFNNLVRFAFNRERWEDNGDGTANDTWLVVLNQIRLVEREHAATRMRERAARVAEDPLVTDVPAAIRAINLPGTSDD